MTKPIPDKAEVVLEYPEKFYAGTFERSARFDARFDDRGLSLLLDHPGDADTRKSVHLHLHYALFADILRELTRTAAIPADHALHRRELGDAAKALHAAFAAASSDCVCRGAAKGSTRSNDASKMTAEEEVLLLHLLE